MRPVYFAASARESAAEKHLPLSLIRGERIADIEILRAQTASRTSRLARARFPSSLVGGSLRSRVFGAGGVQLAFSKWPIETWSTHFAADAAPRIPPMRLRYKSTSRPASGPGPGTGPPRL